jgi:hypothetical protein
VTAGATAGTSVAFRCSAASRELAEPLEGTASTVRAFLLVEAPGPWGVDAVRDCRMDEAVKQRLLALERNHKVRPLLVRRHGGGAGGSTRVFASYVHTDRPWVQAAELDDVRHLLDLDLTGLGSGASPGLTPHEDPIFLVCTHGRHDACCAERGRPLAAAMSQVAPEQTWEVSHIGGDRFAANLLVLPHGLYYGRLEPHDAAGLVEAHLAGRLDVEHLRGRSSYAFSVQAAEIYLRRHLGLDRVAPLPLVEHARHGTETRAVFAVDGRRWQVHVHAEVAEPRQLTCRAGSPSTGFSHVLLGLTEV